MKREPGFYWVKFEGEWMVGEYYHFKNSNPVWFLPADERDKFDFQFDEINEHRIIAPDEPNRADELLSMAINNVLGVNIKDCNYPEINFNPEDYKV